jgi:hypothetical protein
MRAPRSDVRSQNEIIREIVAKLAPQDKRSKPWSEGDLISAAITVDVGGTIKYLVIADQEVRYRGLTKAKIPFRGKQKDNEKDFEVIREQVRALRESLRNSSSPALTLLFSAEVDISGDRIQSVEEQTKGLHSLHEVIMTLAKMEARCDFLIRRQPGEHGNAGYRQRRVADETWRLLRRHGKDAGGGTPGTVLGDIASLLWEAMTGEADRDLQRACKAALQAASTGELRNDGQTIGRGKIFWAEESSTPESNFIESQDIDT